MKHIQKIAFAAMTSLAVMLPSCSHDHDKHHEAEEPEAHANEGHAHSGEIVIGTAQARAMGVEASPIEASDFHGVISVGGQLLAAQGDESVVVATVAGTVKFARPLTEGMAVAKGATLARLSGAHLQDGDPAAKARVAYESAKADYERAMRLAESQIVSAKELNALRAQYETARLAYEATPQTDGGSNAVTAPIGGYVKACHVAEGDYVSVGQPIATIAQNRRLYLRADLPERHYGQLAAISGAKFRTASTDSVMDIGQLGGRLLSTGRSSSDRPGYIPVTFAIDNARGLLPGSYAEVWLTTAKRSGVLTVPVEAITEQQGAHYAYIREDSTCYERREVALGANDGQRVEIVSGLHPGDNVVTRGAVSVKLASAANAIPAHTHNH